MEFKNIKNLNFKAMVFALMLLIVVVLTKSVMNPAYMEQLVTGIDQLGVWAPVLYVGLYILISGILLPSIVFKVFAGTLFGVFYGVVFASIAATISSLIKFLLARYFFKDAIMQKINSSERSLKIDKLIEKKG